VFAEACLCCLLIKTNNLRLAFFQRLEELKKIGDPVAKRAADAEARPDAIQELQKTIVTLRKFVTKFDEGAEEYVLIIDSE
jgi:hypothetical protein